MQTLCLNLAKQRLSQLRAGMAAMLAYCIATNANYSDRALAFIGSFGNRLVMLNAI